MFEKFRHCRFNDCAYSHKKDRDVTRIDELEREALEMKEKYKLICVLCEGLQLQVGEIQIKNYFEERESRRNMEVSQLNESLANMLRICDNLKLEIARIN